jgi:hypothetical protein
MDAGWTDSSATIFSEISVDLCTIKSNDDITSGQYSMYSTRSELLHACFASGKCKNLKQQMNLTGMIPG